MNQDCRGIAAGDIAQGTACVEPSRLSLRVVPGHPLWPDTVLAAIKIKLVTRIIFFRRRRDAHCPDGFLRFFFGDGRLSLVERTRPSIPGPGNIPISRQGKQYSWARVYRESAHQGQITTRRLAGDRNSVGIDSEKLWAALTQPSVRILQIFDDRRQLCLRGQTVID